MKYLYYCNSIYQIINVLKVHLSKRNENYIGDIIIQRAFEGADEIKDNLIRFGLFNKVYIFDKDRKTYPGLYEKARPFIQPHKCLLERSGLDISTDYDFLCIPKVNLFLSMVWRCNHKAVIEFYEEGVGTYFHGPDKGFSSKKYDFAHKIFNFGKSFTDFDKIYVNSVELMNGLGFNAVKIEDPVNLNCFPFLTFDDLILSVFYSKNIHNFNKINWISQKTTIPDYWTNNEDLLNLLEDKKDSVLYRPHPRYSDMGGKNFIHDDLSEPYEVKIIFDKKIEQKAFISHFSTAMFVPKLLFNKEPYLIFLYRMYSSNTKDMDRIVNKFIDFYSNKQKIFVINNKYEFEEMCRYLIETR